MHAINHVNIVQVERLAGCKVEEKKIQDANAKRKVMDISWIRHVGEGALLAFILVTNVLLKMALKGSCTIEF